MKTIQAGFFLALALMLSGCSEGEGSAPAGATPAPTPQRTRIEIRHQNEVWQDVPLLVLRAHRAFKLTAAAMVEMMPLIDQIMPYETIIEATVRGADVESFGYALALDGDVGDRRGLYDRFFASYRSAFAARGWSEVGDCRTWIDRARVKMQSCLFEKNKDLLVLILADGKDNTLVAMYRLNALAPTGGTPASTPEATGP